MNAEDVGLLPLLLVVGVSASLLVIALAASAAGLTEHGLEARDPAPPVWRSVWALIRLIAVVCRPLLGPRAQHRLRQRLRQAGLEFAIQPDEFVAGRVLAAVVGGAAGVSLTQVLAAPSVVLGSAFAIAGFVAPSIGLRDRIRIRRRAIRRQLPFILDLVTLAVESGMNPASALGQAAAVGPRGPMRDELVRVLRDIRTGRTRADALRAMSDRVGLLGVTSFVAALSSSESQGSSLGPLLRAQAEQRRNERFLAAERAAMQAPVKLLFPLVVFIFPGTFAVLLYPIVVQLFADGAL